MTSFVSRIGSVFRATDSARDDDASISPAIPASIPEVTDVLSNDRRCWALADVNRHGSTTLREMTDRRARQEYGSGYTGQERKRVYVTLYQNHLPILDDAGALVFTDGGAGNEVSKGPNFDGYIEALRALESVCINDPAAPNQ